MSRRTTEKDLQRYCRECGEVLGYKEQIRGLCVICDENIEWENGQPKERKTT